MRMFLFSFIACVACTSEHPKQSVEDVETRIKQILSEVRERGSQASGLFVEELSPRGFPLGTEGVTSADAIRRLRTIDGRILVDLLATRNGTSVEMRLWLELRHGVWQIAGWRPELIPIDSSPIQRSSSLDIPRRFAAPSLRRTPSGFRVPGPTSTVAKPEAGPKHQWLKIRPRVREVKGRCPSIPRLKSQLQDALPQIRRCHEVAFPTRTRAAGRVVLRYANSTVSVEESTTTSASFSTCLEKTITAQARGDSSCTYVIDLLLSTRR